MRKCPFYGQCTIDAELLASVGEENKPSQRFRYESIRCKGEGRPSEQWKECDRYLERTGYSYSEEYLNGAYSEGYSGGGNNEDSPKKKKYSATEYWIGFGISLVIFGILSAVIPLIGSIYGIVVLYTLFKAIKSSFFG